MTLRSSSRFVIACGALVLAATLAARAQQPAAPQAPTGPLAPEKFKDIQVLKDVPADQLEITMRYLSAATGMQCQTCHVRDQATGEFAFEKDTRAKTTARSMIRLVQTVNAGDFGARINCGTCHGGKNRPDGLQPAQMMTAEQIAAAAAAQAARQGGPGGAPAGGAPAQGAAAGGRGTQPAGPAVDDVLAKYIESLGGRAVVEKLQARVISGTIANRAGQSAPFTIEEKGAKYRETTQWTSGPVTFAFDGAKGWTQTGTAIADVDGFALAQSLRLADLQRPLQLKDRYQNLTAGRPTRLAAAAPGGTPVDVNLLQGTTAPNVTERLYFSVASGLLVRRQVITRTPLNGTLTETIDYSDYKPVAGVMTPFTIKRNNWNTLDTLTIADAKANPAIDDARFAKPKG